MTAAIWNQLSAQLPKEQHATAAERIKRAESMGLTRIRFFDRLGDYRPHVNDLIARNQMDAVLWLSDFDYLDTAEA